MNRPSTTAAVERAYAAQLPATSEAAVRTLLGTQLPDGSPVAVEQDMNFAFFAPVMLTP